MAHITETVTKTRKIKIFPCVECGNDDIDIYNCGYSSFNCAGGKCKKCGNQATYDNCSWDVPQSTLVKVWNNANNPKKLKAIYEKQIKALQKKD